MIVTETNQSPRPPRGLGATAKAATQNFYGQLTDSPLLGILVAPRAAPMALIYLSLASARPEDNN